jgi:hypothetical protein
MKKKVHHLFLVSTTDETWGNGNILKGGAQTRMHGRTTSEGNRND